MNSWYGSNGKSRGRNAIIALAVFLSLLSAAAVNVGTVSAFGGGTSFTITGYDNVAGADFTGYPGQWLTWRVNVKNDSAVTANYLLTLPYDVTQYFDDGSYRTIDSGFLYPASGPGGSVHVTYKDNTEYQTTGSGWGNGLVWNPFAGVGGIAAGENDNFLIKVYVPSGIVPSKLKLDFWMCDNNSGSSLKHYYIDFYVYPYAPVTMRIYPVADTYVSNLFPTINYGALGTMFTYINTGPDTHKWCLLKFPRPIAANYGIQSVKIYLYAPSSGTYLLTPVVNIRGTATGWTETGVTWNNKPDNDGAVITNTSITAVDAWYSWDVTSYFISKIDYVSFYLSSETVGKYVTFYSKENNVTYRPYLEVTYVPLGVVHCPTVSISKIWCSQENISVVYENVGNMFSSAYPSYENYAAVYLQYTTDAAYIANGGSDTNGFDIAENILVGYVTADGTVTATVGNLVEGDWYWFRAKLWGQRTQAWVVSSGVRNRQLEASVWEYIPPTVTPATITTGSVTNLENATATLGYGLNGGTETYPITVSFFISTDNDLSTVEWDNYVTTFTPSAFQPFASGTLVLVGLTPNTTYYYRAHGYIGERGEHIYGAWAAFTTSLTIVPPGTPGPGESTTGLNITRWAASIGKGLFGGDGLPGSSGTIAGGLFLSMVIMMTILLPLAFLGMPPIGIVGILIVLVGMFTAFTWMPIWITIVIGLGFALIIAREVAGM